MSKTYEQRLQEYAQMHADRENKDTVSKNVWKSEQFTKEAEVTLAAVAHELGAFMEGHMDDNDAETINDYLIENGYLPKS